MSHRRTSREPHCTSPAAAAAAAAVVNQMCEICSHNVLLLLPTGLSTEGIYRVSGNKAEMESMQRQFDQGDLFFQTPALPRCGEKAKPLLYNKSVSL